MPRNIAQPKLSEIVLEVEIAAKAPAPKGMTFSQGTREVESVSWGRDGVLLLSCLHYMARCYKMGIAISLIEIALYTTE